MIFLEGADITDTILFDTCMIENKSNENLSQSEVSMLPFIFIKWEICTIIIINNSSIMLDYYYLFVKV